MPTLLESPLTRRFEQVLLQREAELRAFLHAAAGAAVVASEEPAAVLDFKDVAAEETQAAVTEAATAQAVRELSQVAAALRRIDDGSYGYCEDCGEPIAEQRLQALPATPFCTACQARHEKAAPRR